MGIVIIIVTIMNRNSPERSAENTVGHFHLDHHPLMKLSLRIFFFITTYVTAYTLCGSFGLRGSKLKESPKREKRENEKSLQYDFGCHPSQQNSQLIGRICVSFAPGHSFSKTFRGLSWATHFLAPPPRSNACPGSALPDTHLCTQKMLNE